MTGPLFETPVTRVLFKVELRLLLPSLRRLDGTLLDIAEFGNLFEFGSSDRNCLSVCSYNFESDVLLSNVFIRVV